MFNVLTTSVQFEMPPTGTVLTIIIVKSLPAVLLAKMGRWETLLTESQVNSMASFVSDMCWAFAMLLTTPLVVTVGLSLTIPLSLIGEMIQYGQYSSLMYWIGAAVVFVSFVFINNESREDGDEHEAVPEGRGAV